MNPQFLGLGLGLFLALQMNWQRAHAGELREFPKYYLAEGFSPAEDHAVAAHEACMDARKVLVGSVFGEEVEINQNAVKSFGSLSYVQSMNASSGRVQLVGWKQQLINNTKGLVCLLEYPKTEAEREKKRLSGLPSPVSRGYADFGTNVNDLSGSLEIETVPANANVFIDHQRWGTSPLRLTNRLAAGPHLVRLELESFEPIEETIDLIAGGKIKVTKILKRATAQLAVTTNPTGAEVFINDQLVGRSPTPPLEVFAASDVRITVRHPQTETVSQVVPIHRSEVKEMQIDLPLKPALLSFKVVPDQGVTAELDGEVLDRWVDLKIPGGAHELKLRKEGYQTEFIAIDAPGDTRVVLDTISLKQLPVVESVNLNNEDSESAINPNPAKRSLLSFGSQMSTSSLNNFDFAPVGTNADITMPVDELISIKLRLSATQATGKGDNAHLNLKQTGFSLAVPYVLAGDNHQELLIEAGLGQLKSQITSKGSAAASQIVQKTTDFSMNYRLWFHVGAKKLALTLWGGASIAEQADDDSNKKTMSQGGVSLGFGF